ncbi:TetR/AcrR family transcriptional regulator [Aquincola sp. S2]|uniref:TetR/AcrR family transcriptional regulator n=2 Tax=Pseudaquabacterium terrae TaxID=2732868 RepID=A0ABX2EBI5_9BURK|nr:TetR/AcrR family transcriptional regulator [Aquabacterium terrae]
MKPKDEKKVEAIAAAVYRLAAGKGLAAVTLADIAREAGVATSTLYVYYKSREDLLDDVYQKAKTATVTRYASDDDPKASLKARVRRIWNNIVDNRIENRQQVAFLEQYYHSELLSETSRALGQRMSAPFIELLVAGQRSEQLKTVPPALLAAAVMGLARETALLVSRGDLPDDETTRANGFQLCWDAIRA